MRDGWSETTLGNVFKIVAGKYVAKEEYVEGGEFWIYGSNSIMGKLDRFLVEQSHVVMAAIGAYAGAVRYSKEPSWINNNAMALVPSEEVMAKYLHLWLESKFDLRRVVVGTGQPYVQRPLLLKEIIELPPLPEQKRIVDLISSVDSYIEALQQQLESAKRSRNAVLHELLAVGGENWVATSLGEIADWGSGGTPKADYEEYYGGAIPWCVIGDLTEGEVWETEKAISQLGLTNSSAKIIDPGSVLLAMYGASIGRTGISAIPMATNQAIASAKCKEEHVLPGYLLVYLQTQKSKFIEMGQGAAQPNISQTIIKSWPITLPPIDHQKKVIERIEFFSKLIEKTELMVSETKKLRSSLLSELLSGSHEIPARYDKVIGAA